MLYWVGFATVTVFGFSDKGSLNAVTMSSFRAVAT